MSRAAPEALPSPVPSTRPNIQREKNRWKRSSTLPGNWDYTSSIGWTDRTIFGLCGRRGFKSTFQQWGDTLPPGQSLTGVFGVNGDNGFPTDNITFSTPLPGDIPGSDTHFLAVGGPTTAECPGPGEAAPGHLCVYEVQSTSNITFWCFCNPEQGVSDQAQSYGTALFMLATDNAEWS